MKSVDKIILHGWGEIQPRKYISLKILQLRSIEAKYRWKQVGMCTELIVIWSEKLCRIQLVKKHSFSCGNGFFLWMDILCRAGSKVLHILCRTASRLLLPALLLHVHALNPGCTTLANDIFLLNLNTTHELMEALLPQQYTLLRRIRSWHSNWSPLRRC